MEFLEQAWHWGNAAHAFRMLAENPSLPESDFLTACACGRVDLVESMLADDNSLAKRKGGPRDWEPILYATWSCFLSQRENDMARVVELLLKNGADPNSSWQNREYNASESALYGCVEADCVQVARVLLAAGAKPSDGESLYHACEKFNIELLQVLGEYGLDADDLSYCLKHAIDMRWSEAIAWFIETGADPNATHPAAQETSLHWAVKRGCSLASIQLLLDASADLSAKTSNGKSAFVGLKGATALDFALRTGQLETAALLAKHGAIATPTQPLDDFIYAVTSGDATTAKSHLAGQPDLVQQLDKDDKCLISHCAQMRSWHAVDLMLDLGWPVEAEGWMGAKTMTWALCFGHLPTIKRLVDLHASLENYGGYFQNAIHTLLNCRWEEGEQLAAFKLLLQQEPEVPDEYFPCGQADYDEAFRHAKSKTE